MRQLILFDVYIDHRRVIYHATAKAVATATGFSEPRVRKAAADGTKVGGKYYIRHVLNDPAGRKFTKAEARKKFGDKNYKEWCEMNRRYGGIVRRNDGE